MGIKAVSGSMLPEDRVARTMDLQEDIAAKIEIIKKNAEVEKGLLPQGDKVGYAANNETIASEFEVAEEEIKKVKKKYNLEAAVTDLKLRQDLFKKSDDTITGLFNDINA